MEFAKALETNTQRYGVELNAETVTHLFEYFKLVQAWNPRLHLVAPCSEEEFATRHVLESLIALQFLKDDSSVVDVGSGAGFPIIPCLIVRPSLKAALIESSQKKAIFLREALRLIENKSAKVLNSRFEETETPFADFVTCRAIEKFSSVFKTLIRWSPPNATLLLFGGNDLRAEIEKEKLYFETVQMPDSKRRFLFAILGRGGLTPLSPST
jgi:16S rRNA (guanine527-N7)-methyltransferase